MFEISAEDNMYGLWLYPDEVVDDDELDDEDALWDNGSDDDGFEPEWEDDDDFEPTPDVDRDLEYWYLVYWEADYDDIGDAGYDVDIDPYMI